MTTLTYTAVAEQLIDIEYELRRLRLWQAQAPNPQSLESQMPFAVDTLAFHQWLQFIFLPRMHTCVEQQQSLPQSCNLLPMAEQVYADQLTLYKPLLLALARVDQLFKY